MAGFPLKSQILVDGNGLTISHILAFLEKKVRIGFSPAARRRAEQSYAFVQKEIEKRIIYGVNTGFGPMASHIIHQAELKNLQKNLIRSHATGMGEPIPEEYVLAAMLVRFNTLVKGYSGVSTELLDRLHLFLTKRIVPIVPNHGAVGTSGDLVQLAHIALALIGEGEVMYRDAQRPARAVLRELSIPPYELQAKEGLALINGTAMMTGIGALIAHDADRLLALAVRLGALALEIMNGFEDGLDERLHGLRPHKGQNEIARMLRDIVRHSKRMKNRLLFQKKLDRANDVRVIGEDVQEFYSLRCIPQILGPIWDALFATRRDLEIEMNAVTDNPIVDWEKKTFLHGGNFHGDYISFAIDRLKIALVKLTMLSERRINFFLHANVNRRFPPFLNLKKPGLTLGLQGLQFVATSTAARNQTLAFPQYVHSIPTNGDNQDLVSMGTDSALIAAQVVEGAYVVLAIELITLAQAVDALKISKQLSSESKKLYEKLRELCPVIVEDRVLTTQLQSVLAWIREAPEFTLS